MPTLKHQVTPLKSFMPSAEQRNDQQSSVLTGRNFMFDSKGPRSAFATRPLTPFALSSPLDVHGLDINGRQYVFTSDSILTWRNTQPYLFELLYGFDTEIPNASRGPWSGFFLESRVYMAQSYRGLFSGEVITGQDQIMLQPETPFTIPGLITGIKGMAVVHGRAILVNDDTIQWSAVGDMTDLTPAAGGAGFQLISEFAQGSFVGLASFQDSFVVYTTGGPIVGEFIGGDEVWTWYPIENIQAPLNPSCVNRLSDGSAILLSRGGVQVAGSPSKIQDLTPDFNEFFRNYIQLPDGRYTPNQRWRIDYDPYHELLYVSESANLQTHWRTFVLSPTLNMWGLYSNVHYGLAAFTKDTFGPIDAEGLARYFTYGPLTESEPDNSLGYDRFYPRNQKGQSIPSSTMVSRAYVPDPNLPMEPFDPQFSGWYKGIAQIPRVGSMGGLDAEIEIGYVRPPDVTGMVTDVIEFQEMGVSNLPAMPNFPVDFRTRHHQADFYPATEDWNSPGVATTFDITEDLNLSTDPDVDLLFTSDNDSEDYNSIVFTDVDFGVLPIEDWNNDSIAEEWNNPYLGFNPYSYQLQWLASLDGITFDTVEPRMARFDSAMQVWTGITSGNHHRIKLSATEPLEFFYPSIINVTIQYGGKIG